MTDDPENVTRRRFAVMSGAALASLAFGGGCYGVAGTGDGRIAARPRRDVKTTAIGRAGLGLGSDRDGILQMPAKVSDDPLPLFVALHGAGGSASGVLGRLGAFASDAGVAVMAPDSRDSTWDAIGGAVGPDVAFLNRALQRTFETVLVDPERVSIGGFSDGATYALTLGLINGDLFRRIVAFSPGFLVEGTPHGQPRIFISHGTRDEILPINQCSRRIVPRLRRRGLDVTFQEFDGGHTVPPEIAREGLRWAAEIKSR